MKNFKESWT